ncbi:hypothetical protein CPB86DRAFT_292824 [Serendipita vermifera]|nr:hypothetical protein CPB86DRAFT_292824 [Serendipita vermifera]
MLLLADVSIRDDRPTKRRRVHYEHQQQQQQQRQVQQLQEQYRHHPSPSVQTMTNNTTTAPTARYPSGWYYSQEQHRSGTTSIASSTTAPLLLTGAVLTNATITSDHSNSCIQNTTASSLPSITTACGLCARPVVLQNPHAYTNLQTGFSCAS